MSRFVVAYAAYLKPVNEINRRWMVHGIPFWLKIIYISSRAGTRHILNEEAEGRIKEWREKEGK
jgi:hypothetical protein